MTELTIFDADNTGYNWHTLFNMSIIFVFLAGFYIGRITSTSPVGVKESYNMSGVPGTNPDVLNDKKCKAMKRNGNPCKQTNDLTKDGYCKYHNTPKYRPDDI